MLPTSNAERKLFYRTSWLTLKNLVTRCSTHGNLSLTMLQHSSTVRWFIRADNKCRERKKKTFHNENTKEWTKFFVLFCCGSISRWVVWDRSPLPNIHVYSFMSLHGIQPFRNSFVPVLFCFSKLNLFFCWLRSWLRQWSEKVHTAELKIADGIRRGWSFIMRFN